MKTRLNLTIDRKVLNGAKAYAASKNTSVSELVEEYFRSIHQPSKGTTIVELVDELPAPKIDISGDLKKRYYESQAGRHGS